MFKQNLEEHLKMFEQLTCVETELYQSVEVITSALAKGKKLFLVGNGGSAADAQHLAAEFTGRFNYDRDPLAAIALTTDTSALTCISNDYAFTDVFSRQVRALSQPGDVIILISTSGNSKNLIEAANWCKQLDVYTIGLLGGSGGALADLVNLSINMPSQNTARIQEGHIFIGHCIAEW